MSRVYCDGSKRFGRVDSAERRSVGLRLTSLPRWNTGTVCCERGAEGNIVASCDLHDGPDRVHYHRWLVDRDDVTGLLSRDQTSSF